MGGNLYLKKADARTARMLWLGSRRRDTGWAAGEDIPAAAWQAPALRCMQTEPIMAVTSTLACKRASRQGSKQASNPHLREGWASVPGVGSLSRTVRGPTAAIVQRPENEVLCYLRQGSRWTK